MDSIEITFFFGKSARKLKVLTVWQHSKGVWYERREGYLKKAFMKR